MTRSGMTLGTLAYMSPEQVRGEAADVRSDVFSFGLVLYEMLTGTHSFRKGNPMDTGSAILHDEPRPVSASAAGIPPDLDKLINRCLRKDPERRIQHMDDLKLALVELKEDSASGKPAAVPAPKRGHSNVRLYMVLAAAAVLAVFAWLWLWWPPAELEAQLTAVPLTSYPGFEGFPSFSPDGTQVAFQWCPDGWVPGKNCDIYVKQIGMDPPSLLTDTPEQEYGPAWSPDGRYIALKQISTEKTVLDLIPQRGGPERVLVEFDLPKAGDPQDGPYLAWTPDSKWIATAVCRKPAGTCSCFPSRQERRVG